MAKSKQRGLNVPGSPIKSVVRRMETLSGAPLP